MAGQPFGLDPAKAPPAVKASLEPIIRFFSYHDAHPIALSMVLMAKFGPECITWDPEVLKHEIIESFKATSVSEHNWQKIQAFRTLMLVTSPWTEWEVFENIIHALNNNIPEIDVLQHCSMSQLMAGVDMMNQIRQETFSEDVQRYIAACAIESGVTFLPAPLEFAQGALSEPHYRCKDCGTVAELTHEDMRCDFCCERYANGNVSGKPNPNLDAKCGKNIELFLKRDHGPVETRFKEFKKGEHELDEENAVDLQAGKLVVAHRYMIKRREELVEQLEELKSWVSL